MSFTAEDAAGDTSSRAERLSRRCAAPGCYFHPMHNCSSRRRIRNATSSQTANCYGEQAFEAGRKPIRQGVHLTQWPGGLRVAAVSPERSRRVTVEPRIIDRERCVGPVPPANKPPHRAPEARSPAKPNRGEGIRRGGTERDILTGARVRNRRSRRASGIIRCHESAGLVL